ncbi:MAG: hypothetical protein ABIR37_03800 [Candidatus Saccharimonadales bacterium]
MSRFDTIRNIKYRRLLLVVPLILVGLLYFSRAYGALPQRSITIGDNLPSAVTSYLFSTDLSSAVTVGSIKVEFCSNSPLPNEPCFVPNGFDLSSAVLSSQTGETGFSIGPGTDAHTLVLTRAPALTTATTLTFTLDTVTNPSAPGAYFARLQTFPTADASGPDNNFGGLALEISSTLQVSATVPPYLLFCGGVTITGFDCDTVSGNYINFGNFLTSSAKTATTEMVTATNAGSGFNITVNGPTLTSGNNVIPAMAAQDVSRPGVSQFGLNLVANTTPSVGVNPQGTGLATVTPGYSNPDLYKYVSGDTIATRTDSDEFKKFTVSYVVNISAAQPVGVYVTTLSYICLANF